MQPTRLSAAWMRTNAIDPDLFVDRDDDRARLRIILDDLRDVGVRESRILITGDRGIGKSIFTRTVLDAFRADFEGDVITLSIPGRQLGYKRALRELALALSTAVRDQAPDDARKLSVWLDELQVIANADRITEGHIEEIQRKAAIAGDVTADSLFVKLRSRFSWERSHKSGQSHQSVMEVTDELLHAALVTTLERLNDVTDRLVIVFFDDLDQLAIDDDPQRVIEAYKQFLALRPCIALVNLRSETVVDDIRRELNEELELPPMAPRDLVRMLQRREEAIAPPKTRDALRRPDLWRPFQQLAGATGNPYVYLKWCHALLRLHPMPPPADWLSDENLLQLVRKASMAGFDDNTALRRLAEKIDGCLLRDGRWCDRADLEVGPDGLSDEAIHDLVRVGLLIPQNRLRRSTEYRIDPLLALLRPSVADKVRAAG